jgi:hypothetical protein
MQPVGATDSFFSDAAATATSLGRTNPAACMETQSSWNCYRDALTPNGWPV